MTKKRTNPRARRLQSEPTDAEALLCSHHRDRRLARYKFAREFGP